MGFKVSGLVFGGVRVRTQRGAQVTNLPPWATHADYVPRFRAKREQVKRF